MCIIPGLSLTDQKNLLVHGNQRVIVGQCWCLSLRFALYKFIQERVNWSGWCSIVQYYPKISTKASDNPKDGHRPLSSLSHGHVIYTQSVRIELGKGWRWIPLWDEASRGRYTHVQKDLGHRYQTYNIVWYIGIGSSAWGWCLLRASCTWLVVNY